MRQVDYSRLRPPAPYPAVSAPLAAAAASPVGSRPDERADIRVGPNGRVEGVDGMLDQIAGALVKHARPVLLEDVLPAVRSDVQMQQRVGAAIGKTISDELRPWIVLGTLGSLALAAVGVAQWWGARKTR